MDTLLEVEKSYEIYQKRKYLALNYAGCLIFVALAIYFILNADFLTQYCTQTHIRLCPKKSFCVLFHWRFFTVIFWSIVWLNNNSDFAKSQNDFLFEQ